MPISGSGCVLHEKVGSYPRELGSNKGASLVAQTVKNLPVIPDIRVQSLGQEDPWRKEWLPTPGFLPREFCGQRSLAGYSPWGRRESDMTEQLVHTYMPDKYVPVTVRPHVAGNLFSLLENRNNQQASIQMNQPSPSLSSIYQQLLNIFLCSITYPEQLFKLNIVTLPSEMKERKLKWLNNVP